MIPVVVGSSPIGHPTLPSTKPAPRKWHPPELAAYATAGEAFVANLRAALEQVDANTRGAAAGRDPEYLHQLRVGVRRLRSVMRAFRRLLRRRQADALERSWRAILQTLGNARDWDVFRQSLPAGALQQEASRRRAEAQGLARALVRSARFRNAQARTLAWAQGRRWRRHADPAQRLSRFARRALQRLHESLHRAAGSTDWQQDAARRHKLRIRLKRMRYGCDFFAAAFPHRHARAFLEQLHALQDILGELNDIDVQRQLLRRIVPRGSLPALVGTAAAVRTRLAARERELIAALSAAWTAFETRRPFWQSGSRAERLVD